MEGRYTGSWIARGPLEVYRMEAVAVGLMETAVEIGYIKVVEDLGP